MVTIYLPGDPVPASRPRVTVNGTYTPKRYRRWKAAARDTMALAYRAEPMIGPLTVVVDAYWRRPKRLGEGPREPKPLGCDIDNQAKGVLDAANGILYVDDRQVTELIVRKWYAGSRQNPGVEVTVMSAVGGTDCTKETA